MRIIVLLATLVATIGAALGAAPTLRYADGRLSGALRDADVAAVLGEIARQAALEIRGSLTEPRAVTLELSDVPVDQALARVLGSQSFTLTYRGGRLHGVRLVGGADPNALIAAPAGPVEVPHHPNDYDGTGALAASHAPIPIGGRLARAVGADETTFAAVMGVAMQHPDPRVRADALRIGLRTLEGEPELRAPFLHTLDQMTDERLAAWITNVAGPYAADVVRHAARTTRLDTIKLRAAAVERHLAAR